MNKKKLQAAIAPFPIKQSDKERFVNTITEMSSSGGGGIEYEYYKFDENFRDFDIDNPDTQNLFFTIFLHSYKIISIIKKSKNSNVNILLETSPFLNTVIAGLDKFLRSFYFYFKVIKEDIKYTLVYEDEGNSKLTTIGEININITGADFIEKIAKIYLMQGLSAESITEEYIQQATDMFKQMLIPITKEEYESLIGQEVPD